MSSAAQRRTPLLVVTAGSGLALGLTGPLVPVLAVDLGATAFGAGAAVAALQVPVVVLGLLGSRWTPRLPLRRTVTASLALCAAGAALAALAAYPALVAGRALQGVGVGLLTGAAGYALTSRGGRAGGGAGFGSFQSAWFAGIAAGPVAALAVAVPGGDLVTATFTAAAAVATAAAVLAAAAVRGERAPHRPRLGLPERRGPRPSRRLLLLSGAGQATRSGLAVTVVPLVGVGDGLGTGTLLLALTALGVADVLAMLAASRLPARLDRRLAMALSCAWGVVCVGLIGLGSTTPAFVLGCAALGATVGSTWVLPAALVLDSAQHLETAFGWYRIACDTGLLLGALAAGLLALAGPAAALAWWSAPLVATGVLALAVPRRPTPHTPTPAVHLVPRTAPRTAGTTPEEALP
ncbi:MFS transporter [Kineococcus gypseus]|uniref:MFS transporter n=1 Tax=Kineococcus gypseus TaxID=1637102 RepID=UPI003D7D1092